MSKLNIVQVLIRRFQRFPTQGTLLRPSDPLRSRVALPRRRTMVSVREVFLVQHQFTAVGRPMLDIVSPDRSTVLVARSMEVDIRLISPRHAPLCR